MTSNIATLPAISDAFPVHEQRGFTKKCISVTCSFFRTRSRAKNLHYAKHSVFVWALATKARVKELNQNARFGHSIPVAGQRLVRRTAFD